MIAHSASADCHGQAAAGAAIGLVQDNGGVREFVDPGQVLIKDPKSFHILMVVAHDCSSLIGQYDAV
jgi:hypothetical protein